MKIAIITGGSRGLGKNMAMAIAAKGQDVILTYHNKKAEADEVVALIEQHGQKAVALQLDTSDIKSFAAFGEAVKETLKHTWNRNDFDFLINNAGFGIHAPLTETTEEQFDQLVTLRTP
ncbi:hypothetical protein KDW_32400 [Dictyobacter vulcani]|uniref:Short-chain dehydrogenase n=1 Tax=Dictyobacter vulcani TaxID=2607529 RepID=A0A5J4KH67_9CHLR|nr:SDR family NAD(P)-dependent oxidoreductase [Dictyobacter vulcani]GER89078.1 hypothetical protein KDW_32400 [Dictyobacter vulcani]